MELHNPLLYMNRFNKTKAEKFQTSSWNDLSDHKESENMNYSIMTYRDESETKSLYEEEYVSQRAHDVYTVSL